MACSRACGHACSMAVVVASWFSSERYLRMSSSWALYGGSAGKMDWTAPENREGRKSVTFLEEVLGAIDLAYRDHGRLIYEMFRYGRCTSSDLTS